MSCKKFCLSEKARLTEDPEWLRSALEVFLRAHRLLRNFTEFFKFHSDKCCSVNYDAIPLHGALEIVSVALTSIIGGKVLKRSSQQSGLFHDAIPCIRCEDLEEFSECIIRKVDTILMSTQKCWPIEKMMNHIKDVLVALDKSAPCSMTEKQRLLSLVLKEMVKKLICCGQRAEEPLSDTQTRLTLNLVNNFIRDSSEKRSPTRPCLRICRFCERVINEMTRQWGTFCCNEAQQFNCIRQEWFQRQSISDAHTDEQRGSPAKAMSLKDKAFLYLDEDSKTRVGRLPENTCRRSDTFDRRVECRSMSGTPCEKASRYGLPAKHGGSVPCREQDKFDRVEDEDLTETVRTAGKMEGEIKRSRNIRGTGGEYPIMADGRQGRDRVPYKSEPGEIRGSRGLRDADEKRAADGKTRKIKKVTGHSEHTTDSEKDKERRRRSASVETKKSRSKDGRRRKIRKDASEKENEDERTSEKRRNRRKPRKDASEKETEDEGTSEKKRRRRKARAEEKDVETDEDETLNTSESKGNPGTKNRTKKKKKKKKKEAADDVATDSESRDVSRSVDEEGKVSKRGRKWKDRLSGEEDKVDSDSRKKHGDGKKGTRGAEDKSTLDSEGRGKKKRGRASSARAYSDYSGRGTIEYQLSNQHFVELGWTILPVAKTMRKITYYQTQPAKPHLNWFKRHKLNGKMHYEDGSAVFVNFLADGSAEVYYPNGTMAIRYHRPQNRKYDMYTVFSPGGRDCMGVERTPQIIAAFDTMGNGAVFDENGATRLSYNQIGGIWRDNRTGVPLIWKWAIYEEESITKTVHVEKPAMHLEKLLLNSSAKKILRSSGSPRASTSPSNSRNKEKKVEVQKPVVQEHEEAEEEVESGIFETQPENTRHFRMICFSLNDYISLRILNRSNINLQFSTDKKRIKIELGTIINLNKEVESYFADSVMKNSVLKCRFEKLLPSRLKIDSSTQDIAEEFEKVRQFARERKRMMNKYRPFLRAWQMSGTRCRPR